MDVSGRSVLQLERPAPERSDESDEIWLVTDPAAHTVLMEQIQRNSFYLDLELPMLEKYDAASRFMWKIHPGERGR